MTISDGGPNYLWLAANGLTPYISLLMATQGNSP